MLAVPAGDRAAPGAAAARGHQPDQGVLRRPARAAAPPALLRPLASCSRKGAVYSRTTTWVFRAGPIVGLAATAGRPGRWCRWAACRRRCRFAGDLLLFAYLLGLMRFFTVVAALDTGSSFEGMGASREVLFSALAEPALLLGLAAVARETRSVSLSDMLGAVTAGALGRRRGRPWCWWRRRSGRVPGRERPHPGGRSEHAPGADHDPRGHGAGSRRAGPGLHPVRRGAQALGAGRAPGRTGACPCGPGSPLLDAGRRSSAGMLVLAVRGRRRRVLDGAAAAAAGAASCSWARRRWRCWRSSWS